MKLLYFTILLTIFATILHGQNCEQKDFSRKVWFEKDSIISVGLENNDIEAIYPENSIVKIKNDEINLGMSYLIYNMTGKLISTSQINKKEGEYLVIDLTEYKLSSGFYFISIEKNNKNFVYKLINTK